MTNENIVGIDDLEGDLDKSVKRRNADLCVSTIKNDNEVNGYWILVSMSSNFNVWEHSKCKYKECHPKDVDPNRLILISLMDELSNLYKLFEYISTSTGKMIVSNYMYKLENVVGEILSYRKEMYNYNK